MYLRAVLALQHLPPMPVRTSRLREDGLIRCCRCGEWVSRDRYYNDRRGVVPSYCKVCTNEQHRLWTHRTGRNRPGRQRPPGSGGFSFCMRCEERLPVEQFYPNRSRSDGLCIYCKACSSAICALRRLKKPAKEIRGLVRKGRVKCECGRVKLPGAGACRRCEAIDGTARGQIIISTLRTSGGSATTEQLVDATGYVSRHVVRVCGELVKEGRLRRQEEDASGEVTWFLLGGSK